MTPEQEALVLDHQNVVHHVLYHLVPQLARYDDRDGLFGAAQLGLVQAALSFDPDYGTPFVAFATHRIHGAVLDEARRGYRGGRSARSRHSQVAAARTRLGEQASWAAIAEHLGWSKEEVHRVRAEAQFHNPLSLDWFGDVNRQERCPADGPEELLERHEITKAVRVSLHALTPRHRKVVEDYFFRERSMVDIGQDLGVSSSRVCQLLGEAVATVRDVLVEEQVIERPATRPRKPVRHRTPLRLIGRRRAGSVTDGEFCH